MQNFGKIKNAFNDILAESIVDKSIEKRKIAKRFVKAISESKILKAQFLVYNNIENKVDKNEFSANLFVTENIKLLKSIPKDVIIGENKKLINMSQMVSSRLNNDYEDKELHEAITTLIFTETTPRNIQEVTNKRLMIVKFINENKEKEIIEESEIPTSFLANLIVDKFNEKYADLTETEHKVLNIMMDSDNDEAREHIFTETLRSCIDLANNKLKESSSKEKLLDVKDKLLRTSYIKESFTEDITRLLDLSRTLSKE